MYKAIMPGDWKNFIGMPPIFITNGRPSGWQLANGLSSTGW